MACRSIENEIEKGKSSTSPSNRVGPACLLPPADPSHPPRFAGPRTQPIGLASTGLPSLAGPISGVGSARPQTPRAPTASLAGPPGLAGLLALVASHAWPSKPDVITSFPRWLTGGTPLSSPSLAPSSAFRRQSTGAVGGKGGNSMPPRPLSAVCALTTDRETQLEGCHAGTSCPTGSRTVRDRCRTSQLAMAMPCTCPLPIPRLFDQGARNWFCHCTRSRVATLKP